VVATGDDRGQKSPARQARRPDVGRLRENLEAYMARQGLRSTEQRRLIVDTFFDSPEHVTLDGLLERVRAIDSRIGYATVYRTMKMLSDGGVAHEQKFGDGLTRYELADGDLHHDHLICIECGQIQEFEEPQIEQLQDRVATRYGFEVHHHKHELYGRCRSCSERKR
jgi:Fur family ferric uptake transcriptional regulator